MALRARKPVAEDAGATWPWVPSEAPPPPVIEAPAIKRKGDGMPAPVSMLLGLVAGVIGVIGWAVLGPADERFAGFLAPVVGLLIGAAVRWRAAKSTIERPIAAVTITMMFVLVGQFAVERNISTGRRDLPGLNDLGNAASLVQDALEKRPFIMLLWLAAIVVAGALASQSDEI
jgi:hypothetical protein